MSESEFFPAEVSYEKDGLVVTYEDLRDLSQLPAGNEFVFKVIDICSRHRPEASSDQIRSRGIDLSKKRQAVESWGVNPGQEIKPSTKQVSGDLELKPIVTFAVLAGKEWEGVLLASQKDESLTIDQLRHKLGDQEFFTQAAEVVNKMSKARVERAEKSAPGRLTYGVEVEIFDLDGISYIPEQRALIDRLQDLGIPITYDGIRELPLPKSGTMNEQLKAVMALMKTEVIKVTQNIGIHLTVGGLQKDDLSQLTQLNELYQMINPFEAKRRTGQTPQVLANARKTLYEAKPRGDRNPEGMPFRVRKSSKEGNVVVELRDLPEISNFDQLVNGADTVRVMLESLGGFQRVEADDNPDDIDLQLHIIWKKMVDQGRSQLKQVDITDFDSPYTSEDDYKKRVGVIWNRTTISDRIRDPEIRARNHRMQEVFDRTIQVQQRLEAMRKSWRRSTRGVFKGKFEDEVAVARYIDEKLAS